MDLAIPISTHVIVYDGSIHMHTVILTLIKQIKPNGAIDQETAQPVQVILLQLSNWHY